MISKLKLVTSWQVHKTRKHKKGLFGMVQPKGSIPNILLVMIHAYNLTAKGCSFFLFILLCVFFISHYFLSWMVYIFCQGKKSFLMEWIPSTYNWFKQIDLRWKETIMENNVCFNRKWNWASYVDLPDNLIDTLNSLFIKRSP